MNEADPAERLLKSLGVSQPREIELEDIAFDQGAEVRYCDLIGCEADILGYRDRAIISIDRSQGRTRKRFSIAHELGHWYHHRGKRLRCRVEEFQPKHRQLAERKANGYAASLLMPHFLLMPRARDHRTLTFKVVEQFSTEFRTSLSAMAIRLVETDVWPCILVCHTQQGRKWFTEAPALRGRLFPKADLDADSSAFDVIFGQSEGDRFPRPIRAHAWFDGIPAQRCEIHEQAKRVGNEALVLITIKDHRVIEDGSPRIR